MERITKHVKGLEAVILRNCPVQPGLSDLSNVKNIAEFLKSRYPGYSGDYLQAAYDVYRRRSK